MTSTNGSQTNHSSNLYTIYPGSLPIQGNVNYGFYSSHPQAPPPRYEDVMSGHYPYINDTSTPPQPTSANVNADEHFNYSDLNNFQSLQSCPQEVYKHKKFDIAGVFLFAIILTGIFLWRAFF